jgi:hypothetical protein
MVGFLTACRFNPTAGSTTDWTYSSAVSGYQSPTAAGVANGATYRYRAESSDLTQWEVGEGAYNTGTGVLARTTIKFNSSGGTSKINFSTTPQVAIVVTADDFFPPTTVTNSLGGNVSLTTSYQDGPTCAQGTAGTWFASGTITVLGPNVGDDIFCKLWDGSTVIASTKITIIQANYRETISLSGLLATPTANIKMSVKNNNSSTGTIVFNETGNSKDSTLTVFRIG